MWPYSTFHEGLQESAWSDGGYAKLRGSREVFEIVSHEEFGLSRNGELEDHVIAGVGEAGTPEVKDLLMMGLSAEVIDQVGHMLGSLPGGAVPKQDGFVFEDERHGQDEIEQAVRNEAENLERSPGARAPASDKDGGIEDEAHQGQWYHR